MAQSAPEPVERPDPVDIPIGTEANAHVELPIVARPRRPLPASMEFRVATWNLAARKPGEPEETKPEPKPKIKKWRHTFGAERKTAQWREIDKGDFGADIIALQGVKGRRTIGRLFNARYFHVVVSRQLLEQWTTRSGAFEIYRDDAPATTAVIYRRRRGVRIAGFRHFLPKSTREQPQQQPAAITALRLHVYRKMLWIASADLAKDCRKGTANGPCRGQNQVLSDFIDWAAKEMPRYNTPILLLGSWPEAVKAKFSDAGLQDHMTTENRVDCAPQPSAITVIRPVRTSTDALTLDKPSIAKTNACVAIADLKINLANNATAPQTTTRAAPR